MKRITNVIVVCLAMLMVFGVTTGVLAAKKPHFVLVSRIYGHPYWKNVEDGQMMAAAALGIDAQYVGPDAVEVAPQISTMESLIAQRVDGIALGPNDPEALNPYIKKAMDMGIPVITLDTDAPTSDRITYVGTDNKAAGRMAGENMVQLTNGKGKVGVIVSGLGSANMNERLSGVREAFADHPDMAILTIEDGRSDLNTCYNLAIAMLQGYPEMNGIVALDASSPIGSAKAIEEARKVNQVTIVGFDAMPQTIEYIQKGTIAGTVVQREWLMGYLTMDVLLKIKNGENVPPMVDTGTLWITKDNIDTMDELLKELPE